MSMVSRFLKRVFGRSIYEEMRAVAIESVKAEVMAQSPNIQASLMRLGLKPGIARLVAENLVLRLNQSLAPQAALRRCGEAAPTAPQTAQQSGDGAAAAGKDG